MLPIIFDPIYIMLSIVGYFIMFALASFVAPKVAGKFSGKFSLYTSMALLLILILSVSALIIYAILFYFRISVSITALIAFLLAINILIYLASPYMINLSYNAKRSDELQRMVDEVAMRVGVRDRFKAVVVSSPPNAFAYGNFLSGKYVAVSDSMLRLLSREELEGVIAHEIGHHKHKDNAIMLLIGLLPSLIFYLGYALIHTSFRDDRNSKQLAFIGIAAVIVSFVIQILVLAFSRLREYYADFEGVRVSGKFPMQSALAKIHAFYRKVPRAYEEISQSSFKALFIYAFTNSLANPYIDIERIKRERVNPVEEFLSTHPPLPKRLRFIDSLPY